MNSGAVTELPKEGAAPAISHCTVPPVVLVQVSVKPTALVVELMTLSTDWLELLVPLVCKSPPLAATVTPLAVGVSVTFDPATSGASPK
jgi:hypothetical protein